MFWTLIDYLKFNPDIPFVFTGSLFTAWFTLIFAVYILFYNQVKARYYWLVAASLYFYYRVSGPYVALMLLTALADYLIGMQLFNEKNENKKKLLLFASALANLGLLFAFKYTNFALESWSFISGTSFQPLAILVPVGISFYSFRSFSYVLDIYREMNDEPEKDFGYYLLYVSFFPMILAGPITKSELFLTQLNKPQPITEPKIGQAFYWIIEGLFKKVVIADFLAANYINRVFDAPQMFTGLECMTASIFYGIYLYYDFSGYTDMAKGMAMLFGLDIGINFNEPFKAQNISDFWRRWHISVSTWFNDYVHFPLSMSWRSWGKKGIILSVIITFVLSGLWHGPAWTFVIWGLLHGLAIAWDVYSQNFRFSWKKKIPNLIYVSFSIVLTQLFLFMTYMVFKNNSLENVGVMMLRIRDEFHIELIGRWIEQYGIVLWVWLAGMLIHFIPTDWKSRVENTFVAFPWYLQMMLMSISVILIYQIKATSSLPFVYLQF